MSRPRRRHALLLAAIPLLLGGCSWFGADPARPHFDPAAPELTTTTTTIPVRPPSVEVLDPGAEPHELLRYEPEPGTSQALITVRTDITQEGASILPVRVGLPPIIHRVDLTIGEPTPTGIPITLRLDGTVVVDPGLDEDDRERIDASLDDLAGLTGSGLVTTRGELTEFAWDGLDGITEELRDGIEVLATQLPGLIAPLPDEPVGSGATWRATSTIVLDGAPIDVTTTYTLAARLGSLMTYTSVAETATGPVELSPLPDGTAAELLSSTSTALADGSLDLAGLLANGSVLSISDQIVRLGTDPDTTTVDQRIETTVEVTTTS